MYIATKKIRKWTTNNIFILHVIVHCMITDKNKRWKSSKSWKDRWKNKDKLRDREKNKDRKWWSKERFVDKLPGWSGGVKVSCISRHRGIQLIFAYSWARPAILVSRKGKGGMFFISSVSSLSLLFLFLPCPSLSYPLLSLLSLFSLSLGDNTKWPTRVDMSLNPNTIKILSFIFVSMHIL